MFVLYLTIYNFIIIGKYNYLPKMIFFCFIKSVLLIRIHFHKNLMKIQDLKCLRNAM